MGGALQRGSIDTFVTRHLVAWEGTMGVLAIAYLTVDVLADGATGVPVGVIFVFTTVFGGEFAVRLANARNRQDYLRHHWLDLASSVPMVGPLRAIRLLRLLRLVRSAKALNAVQRRRLVDGGSPNGLSLLLLVFTVIWLGAALCYWSMEHTYNADARTFGDALYWAFLTLTTMGYGTASTLHADTRVLAGVVIFVGVGLVSLVSGRVAATILHDESDSRITTRLGEIETELRRLRLSLERRDERDPPAA